MKKLSNRNKLEMLIGKLVILLVESAIGCALILGFFWLVGFITSWAEQSTLRMIIFFVVMGIIKYFFHIFYLSSFLFHLLDLKDLFYYVF